MTDYINVPQISVSNYESLGVDAVSYQVYGFDIIVTLQDKTVFRVENGLSSLLLGRFNLVVKGKHISNDDVLSTLRKLDPNVITNKIIISDEVTGGNKESAGQSDTEKGIAEFENKAKSEARQKELSNLKDKKENLLAEIARLELEIKEKGMDFDTIKVDTTDAQDDNTELQDLANIVRDLNDKLQKKFLETIAIEKAQLAEQVEQENPKDADTTDPNKVFYQDQPDPNINISYDDNSKAFDEGSTNTANSDVPETKNENTNDNKIKPINPDEIVRKLYIFIKS